MSGSDKRAATAVAI